MMAALALTMFLVQFLVVFVIRILIQKRNTGDSGLRAGVLSAEAGPIERTAGWLLLLALTAGLTAPIVEMAGVEPLTSYGPLRAVGVAVVAMGIALTFAAQLNMGSEWRIGVDLEEQTGLVTHGGFAIVRNPIFGSMMLTAGGLALMVPNWIAITGFVLLIASVELQVRCVEEPHLRRLHGADYFTYESRVGRFVPGVGRRRDASRP